MGNRIDPNRYNQLKKELEETRQYINKNFATLNAQQMHEAYEKAKKILAELSTLQTPTT